MALQLWETLKDAITAYTGLTPATFFTVVALGIAVYYTVASFFGTSDHGHHSRSRELEEQMEPLPPPVQLGEVTEEELKLYDGSDPKKPLLMAIKGQIYDVSQSRIFYGPGGPYHLFAGKDASRALAKMSFEDKDLTGDISGLGVFELEALQDWEYKFMSKYVKVGTVKKQVPVTEGATNAEAAETSGEAIYVDKNPVESEFEIGAAAAENGPSKAAETSGEVISVDKDPVESQFDIAAAPAETSGEASCVDKNPVESPFDVAAAPSETSGEAIYVDKNPVPLDGAIKIEKVSEADKKE